jgi:hypothetical protein
VSEPAEYDRYQRDAGILAEIGQHLMSLVPFVEVSIPSKLASEAVAAWNRDDYGPPILETPQQAGYRYRAADLALLGLAISARGRWGDDDVVLKLRVEQLAAAVIAAVGSS